MSNDIPVPNLDKALVLHQLKKGLIKQSGATTGRVMSNTAPTPSLEQAREMPRDSHEVTRPLRWVMAGSLHDVVQGFPHDLSMRASTPAIFS